MVSKSWIRCYSMYAQEMLSGLISVAKTRVVLCDDTLLSRACFKQNLGNLRVQQDCVIHCKKCARVGGQRNSLWWSTLTSGLGAGGLNSKHLDR